MRGVVEVAGASFEEVGHIADQSLKEAHEGMRRIALLARLQFGAHRLKRGRFREANG